MLSRETELREKLQQAKEEYLKIARTGTQEEVSEKSSVVRGIMQELNDFLAEGAEPCKECGMLPMVMLQTPGTGRTLPVYEAGVGVCGKIPGYECRSLGASAEEAVKKWNTGDRIKAQNSKATSGEK